MLCIFSSGAYRRTDHFVEVALANGLTGDLERLLDVNAPVLTPDKVNTAIFYSINNCLDGLRGIPFGNFLIKQVVVELAAEFPNMENFCTLSPLPRFSKALLDPTMKMVLHRGAYRRCLLITLPAWLRQQDAAIPWKRSFCYWRSLSLIATYLARHYLASHLRI